VCFSPKLSKKNRWKTTIFFKFRMFFDLLLMTSQLFDGRF
jgi:hypothetical protein